MKRRYANIIVDISHEKVDRTFQYLIPPELADSLLTGMKVQIPFGKGNRMITGYVIGITEEPEIDPERVKSITGVEPGGITAESRLIALAAWIRETYGATMNQALKTVLPVRKKMKVRERKRICLGVTKEKGEAVLSDLERRHHTAKARLIRALLENQDLDYDFAVQQLHITPAVIQGLQKNGQIEVETTAVYRNPVQSFPISKTSFLLNPRQQEAAEIIYKEWQTDDPRPCLLHGVTGSGKTLVYMELINRMIEDGRQVIMLIPEIALTWQTVQRFYQRFQDRVSIINSRMTQGERFDQWERARTNKIQIMIGPRSALFTPFPNLGLIIIDEEHENTYKSETTPRYHAREVAIKRGQMEGAHVILGSATPSVEAYYKSEQGEYLLIKMENRYENRQLPKVYTVDLRAELKAGNRSVLSRMLEEKIQERLEKKEQVMLFLNRRGYAGFVSCRACGHVMKCSHCDVSLSAHNNGKLVCHYCGYEIPQVKECPSCGSPYIGGFHAGTQQVEEIVKESFPDVKILRMDYDTTKKKDGHSQILSAFSNEEADILIGTQMIVKGHDFPKVTLVGILAADLSLFAQDYRAGERTFQLLAQAVGRAGRGKRMGEAVIQTYHPEHYSITAAQNEDYQSFYKEEITYRMIMGYPPVSSMIAIHGAGADEKILAQAMEHIKRYLGAIYKKDDLWVVGPAPEAISKVNDIYKRVIYLRHKEKAMLIRLKNQLEHYIEINSGFQKIYIQFDLHT